MVKHRKDPAFEAKLQEAGEAIKNAPECRKCKISSALCDCPAAPCECGHSFGNHRSGKTCRGCKCQRYVAAEGFLSDHDRVRLARDLLGLMRNLWADETEASVRRAIFAERRRITARLRAMPSEVKPHCPPGAKSAYTDAADTLDAEDGIRAGGARVYRASSVKHGGCNFCHRHISARGEGKHDVTVVESGFNGGVVVRFCDACVGAFRAVTAGVK